jgi:hypothetical protein
MRTSSPFNEPSSSHTPFSESRKFDRLRSAGSGPCQCGRHTCGHAGDCHAGGVVRFSRNSRSQFNTSVVLCRECAAPHTSQSRAATFL